MVSPFRRVVTVRSHKRSDLPSELLPEQRAQLEEGRRLFNAAEYWEAHEVWEEAWKSSSGHAKLFFQGLIQAAAAYHLIRTTPRIHGALRNAAKALEKLSGMPDVWCGIAIGRFCDSLRAVCAEAEKVGQEGLAFLGDEWSPTL